MKYILFATGMALVVLLLRAYMPPPPAPVDEGSSNKSGPQAFEMSIPNDVGAAWDKAWEESGEVPLFMVVAADGTNCSVPGKTMPCADVVGHIERLPNLSKTAPIGLSAPPGQATRLRATIADDLRRSGYSQAALIDVRSVTEAGGR